jgi:hypothetical protein
MLMGQLSAPIVQYHEPGLALFTDECMNTPEQARFVVARMADIQSENERKRYL